MKKLLCLILLPACITAAHARQTTDSTTTSKETRSSSTAIWIGLGTVLFVAVIAAKRRRDRNN